MSTQLFKGSFPFNLKGNFLIIRGCLKLNEVIDKAPGKEQLEVEVRENPIKDIGDKCSAEWKVELEDV